MKMDKIWNSGLGIALAILALLVAGRVVRIISWDLRRVIRYAILGGIIVLAVSYFRGRK